MPGDLEWPSVSPDGTKVTFTYLGLSRHPNPSTAEGSKVSLYSLDLNNNRLALLYDEPEPFTQWTYPPEYWIGQIGKAAWSHKSQKMAFVRRRPPKTRRPVDDVPMEELIIMSEEGVILKRMTPVGPLEGIPHSHLAWSPDESEIAFVVSFTDAQGISLKRPHKIAAIHLDTEKRRFITDGYDVDWSPTLGRLVCLSVGSGKTPHIIKIVEPTGKVVMEYPVLHNSPYYDLRYPKWSSDGKLIFMHMKKSWLFNPLGNEAQYVGAWNVETKRFTRMVRISIHWE